jgi:hypothetical protein
VSRPLLLIPLTLAALTGCQSPCDSTTLQAAWRGLEHSPNYGDIVSVLEGSCIDFSWESSKEQILSDESSCSEGDGESSPTIPARLSYYRSCEVDNLELGSAESFAVAAGEPQVAAALSGWLTSQGVDKQVAWEMALVVRGPALLPIDTGYTPARLPNSLPTATAPATRTVEQGPGTRVALGRGERYGALIDALPSNDGTASVLGLSQDGKRVVELKGEVLRSGGYGRKDTLSIWMDSDGTHGFLGFEPILGDEACPERMSCIPPDQEGAPADLGEQVSSLTPTHAARIGSLVDLPAAQVLAGAGTLIDRAKADRVYLAPLLPPVPLDHQVDDMARALGGLVPRYDAEFRALVQETVAWYQQKAILDLRFKQFRTQNLEPMAKWSKEHLGNDAPVTVFYPFSGPDILNAQAIYPDRPKYIMFGLEPVLDIPRDHPTTSAEVARGLWAIQYPIHHILGVNFFRTNSMAFQVGSHPMNGVSGLLMAFLARTDYEIVSAERVTISPEGQLQLRGKRGGPDGIQIRFRRFADVPLNPHPVQEVIYFSQDISDTGLAKSPGIQKYLAAQGPWASFTKAASYLMYRRSFDDIRNAILDRSLTIVTESSGFPYHHIKSSADTWDVELYGAYRGPIPLFGNRCQPDLLEDLVLGSIAPVPFKYGYFPGVTHLVLGKRKAPIAPMRFDGRADVGWETWSGMGYCALTQQYKVEKTP